MATVDDPDPARAGTALPDLAATSARSFRAASAERKRLGKLLSAKDLRKLADQDPDLGAQLAKVGDALTEQEKAATAWQRALAEATRQWQASLAEFAAIHPDR